MYARRKERDNKRESGELNACGEGKSQGKGPDARTDEM